MLPLRKKKTLISFTLCIIVFFASSFFSESVVLQHEPVQNINIPNRTILQIDPHPNMTIGSFKEYLSNYPYEKSVFTNFLANNDLVYTAKSCSILIDENVYTSQIQEKINRYIQDIKLTGYTVLSIDTLSGGNPIEVKDWVKIQYQLGANGVIFIGDIPAAWVEVSGETFPCDLFYMDIDGLWIDNNNDGIYNSHTAGSGDMGPELFVARLFTSSLEWNDEETLLLDYFDKIHQYHSDNLSVPWRGLEYIDEDWYSMNVHLDKIFDTHVNRYDFGYQTTAQEYIQQLQQGHHFVTVCAHSYPEGHHFGRRPTEAATYTHVYVFSPTQRDATLLLGSDDGIIAWLNGEKIIVRDVYTRWLPDQYKIDVTLAEGWNRLLLKISQDGGPYQVSARFTDKQSNPFPDLSYQLNNPEFFGGGGEFIRSWLVNGFHQDDSSSFWEYLTTNYLGVDEGTITPFEGESMGGKNWTIVSSGDPFIDFDEYSGGADFGVTYGYATIYAEEDVSCELWVGYDDGMRAWLNSEEIIMDNRYGSYETDMTKVPVELHAGENHLVVKVSEWMRSHGFSARFSTSNEEYVEGLSFYPPLEPISYIGNWLILGPFEHKDKASRLSMEYIPNESTLAPYVGEDAAGLLWQQAIGNGRPFDIGSYFDKGDWVFSETIQDTDPPVLFYNLFACSAGRFTEKNYLAGSYIFNTSYGLVSIASSKSGSMLNFQDFSIPLSIGKSVGEAFVDWFTAQAPFVQWQKEWYYGMVLCGDPTLTMSSTSDPVLRINIVSPDNGVYLKDNRLFSFFVPVVFGDATIKVDIIDQGHGIKEMEFYLNNDLSNSTDIYPYEYTINIPLFGRQLISIVATDQLHNTVSKEITIWKFF